MEKTTLKKIIGAVRKLEIKKSRNDSQFEFYHENMITNLMNNNYCYLWQFETDTILMLNRHTGDKIEFKIL